MRIMRVTEMHAPCSIWCGATPARRALQIQVKYCWLIGSGPVSALGIGLGNFLMELLVIATSTSHSKITDARSGRPVASVWYSGWQRRYCAAVVASPRRSGPHAV